MKKVYTNIFSFGERIPPESAMKTSALTTTMLGGWGCGPRVREKIGFLGKLGLGFQLRN